MSEIRKLIEQYLDESISEADFQRLWGSLHQPGKDADWHAAIEELLQNKNARGLSDQPAEDAALARIHMMLAQAKHAQPELRPEEEKTANRRVLRMRYWWAAACILLLAAGGTYWWMADRTGTGPADKLAGTEDIQPGKEGAILKLADGSQVLLDTIRNGTVAMQGGVVAKIVDGRLVYEGKGIETVYNTMSTPKGRLFHMTLPDGSNVWLNAASSIRYPTVFSGNERRVEITGEAYFEVKQGAAPFIVNADDRAEVKGLGTQFNINSYENEPSLNTTLLEGVAGVSSNGQSVVLKPGEQARVDSKMQDIKVVAGTDLDRVMAWKKGLFNFHGISLAEAMRQLERWYDIEVEYEDGIPDLRLSGKMTKGVTLNGLMEVLEQLGVHYRLEGRKLIIYTQ